MERLRNHLLRRQMLRWMLVPAVLAVFTFVGCSDDDDDDDNNPPATQTTLSGGFAGGTVSGATETGTLAVTINSGTLAASFQNTASSVIRPASAVVVAAAGSLDIEGVGGVIPVSGSYNTDNDSLMLTGGSYSLRGRRTNTGAGQSIEGIYTGPNGSGAFYILAGAGAPVQSYCGSYTSGTQTDSGFVALSVRGPSITGLSISRLDFGDIIRWNGTIEGDGTARDVSIQDPLNPSGAPLATGTWNTSLDEMTGTYGFGGDTGTWDATVCE